MAAPKKENANYLKEHYKRWSGMVQRCTNPNSPSFPDRRKKNVKIDPVWAHENPDGLSNYIEWINAELLKHPEFANSEFRVSRIKSELDYSPTNCQLMSHVDITRSRISSVMNVDVVVTMRRYKRANPGASLAEMEIKFGFSQANISRSLRGISWSNANEQEPPLPKQDKQEKQRHNKKRNPGALAGIVL